MRYRFLLAGIYLLLIGAIPSSPEGSGQERRSPLRFVNSSVDLGTHRQAQQFTHEFLFVNASANPIEIIQVVTSCGCTSTTVTPSVIEPGGTGLLKAEFDAGAYEDEVAVTIYLFGKDDENAVGEVEAKFQVVPEFRLSEKSIDFGKADPGNNSNHTIWIDPCSAEDLKVLEVRIDSTAFKVSRVESAHTIEKRIGVAVALGERPAQGEHRGILTIRTNSRFRKEAKVPVKAIVTGPFTLEPATLFFGFVTPGSAGISREMTVKRSDGEPFDITRGKAPYRFTKVGYAASSKDNSTWRLTLRLDPRSSSVPANELLDKPLRLWTKGTKTPTLLIPIRAIIQAEAKPRSQSCCAK